MKIHGTEFLCVLTHYLVLSFCSAHYYIYLENDYEYKHAILKSKYESLRYAISQIGGLDPDKLLECVTQEGPGDNNRKEEQS
jgi:hypothetical protein